jgi:hypothetical protein
MFAGSSVVTMGRCRTGLAALLVLVLSTSAPSADVRTRCQVTEDPEYVLRFKAAYREFTGGREFGDHLIHILDCEYLLIVEVPLPPLAFGSDVVYLFWKEGFQNIFMGTLN